MLAIRAGGCPIGRWWRRSPLAVLSEAIRRTRSSHCGQRINSSSLGRIGPVGDAAQLQPHRIHRPHRLDVRAVQMQTVRPGHARLRAGHIGIAIAGLANALGGLAAVGAFLPANPAEMLYMVTEPAL